MNTTEIKDFKVKIGDTRSGDQYKMKGYSFVLDLKISGSDTNGSLAVFEQIGFTPNEGPPLHIHPFQDEALYILEGKFLFQRGDEKIELNQGDSIFLPRNVQHAFIQLSTVGKLLASFIPAEKMEDFFKFTESWTLPLSPDEITQIFENYEVKIIGPSPYNETSSPNF